jgi:excisionase family DNA binding protein
MPEGLSHTTQAQSAHLDKEASSSLTEKRFEPLLDTEEAARLLRMHPRTLRIKARKREIPAVQVGRRWRFRVSVLNHWLEEIAS